MREKIAVILPMYNEEENAPLVLEHLANVSQKNYLKSSIIAVNDGSSDTTHKVLITFKKSYPNLHIVSYHKNKGVGGAIQRGIKYALQKDFTILIFMDADLTHNGNDIPKFLKKLTNGYELVVGSRFIKGGKMIGVPIPRVLISQVGNIFGKILLSVKVNDLTSGYRAAKSDIFRKITLTENGFGIQLEETIKATVAKVKIAEVPIVLSSRRFGYSKMTYNWKLINSYLKLLKKCLTWRYGKS